MCSIRVCIPYSQNHSEYIQLSDEYGLRIDCELIQGGCVLTKEMNQAVLKCQSQ